MRNDTAALLLILLHTDEAELLRSFLLSLHHKSGGQRRFLESTLLLPPPMELLAVVAAVLSPCSLPVPPVPVAFRLNAEMKTLILAHNSSLKIKKYILWKMFLPKNF